MTRAPGPDPDRGGRPEVPPQPPAALRLLQTSAPSVVVGDLTVTLVDAKRRIVRRDGHATELAAASVELARGADRQTLHLLQGVPQAALGVTLTLDDLSDGALDGLHQGLARQFAAHLTIGATGATS